LASGESFEFIVEKDKLEKIRKVIAHNNGEVLSQVASGDDVVIKVRKLNHPEAPSRP
jgi:hypothetical protein